MCAGIAYLWVRSVRDRDGIAMRDIETRLTIRRYPLCNDAQAHPHPSHTQGAKAAADGTAAPLSVAGNLTKANGPRWCMCSRNFSTGAMDLNTLSRSAEVRLKKKIEVRLLCLHIAN